MTRSYRSLIHLRKGIQIKAEGFVAVPPDRKNTLAFFSCERGIKARIDQLQILDCDAFVLSEINDHLRLIDNACDGTHLILAHQYNPLLMSLRGRILGGKRQVFDYTRLMNFSRENRI